MTERWKPIPGYEGYYEISDLGRVKRTAPTKGTWVGRIITPTKGSDGYQTIRLSKDTVKKTYSTHRIVAIVFLGGYKPGLQVNHKNGNKLDPRADNLEWVTPRQNVHHARDVLGVKFFPGDRARGENNGKAKLTENKVRQVKLLLEEGVPVKRIAAQFGVHHSQISRIKSGQAWKVVK